MADEGGDLGLALLDQMNELTQLRMGDLCAKNATGNQVHFERGQSLGALRRLARGGALGKCNDAVVIAAGPSVRRQNPATVLLDNGYDGLVIAADSATSYCLRAGLVPDLIVSVDPQPLILRWFGDPRLTREAVDGEDYFRRQDLDERFVGEDELKANEELLALVNEHGPGLRIALASTSSPVVVQRCLDAGMQVFFYNPMFDAPENGGTTAGLREQNGFPCVNAGGNVGTLSWMLAHAALGAERVALTGVDFGYYGDTPYERTQYYYAIKDLVPEGELHRFFMRIHNPHLGADFITDPAYRWYREAFLELAADASCETWNCTEGGILFGDPIQFRPLREFLRTAQKAA